MQFDTHEFGASPFTPFAPCFLLIVYCTLPPPSTLLLSCPGRTSWTLSRCIDERLVHLMQRGKVDIRRLEMCILEICAPQHYETRVTQESPSLRPACCRTRRPWPPAHTHVPRHQHEAASEAKLQPALLCRLSVSTGAKGAHTQANSLRAKQHAQPRAACKREGKYQAGFLAPQGIGYVCQEPLFDKAEPALAKR